MMKKKIQYNVMCIRAPPAQVSQSESRDYSSASRTAQSKPGRHRLVGRGVERLEVTSLSVDIAGGWAEDGRPGVPRREATAARKAAAQRIAPQIRDCEDATNLADTPRAPHERPPNVVGIGRLLHRVAGGRESAQDVWP